RPALARIRSWISASGSVRASSGSSCTNTISGTGRPAARASSPATSSAISALHPWPAPLNLSTYMPSSSASMMAGSEPPSRSGVTYLVAVTVLKLILRLFQQLAFVAGHQQLAMNPERRVAILKQLVMKFLQREFLAAITAVVIAQLQYGQLA